MEAPTMGGTIAAAMQPPTGRGWGWFIHASSQGCCVAARHKRGGVPYVNQIDKPLVGGTFNLREGLWWT